MILKDNIYEELESVFDQFPVSRPQESGALDEQN
jgi:hypothetical protein